MPRRNYEKPPLCGGGSTHDSRWCLVCEHMEAGMELAEKKYKRQLNIIRDCLWSAGDMNHRRIEKAIELIDDFLGTDVDPHPMCDMCFKRFPHAQIKAVYLKVASSNSKAGWEWSRKKSMLCPCCQRHYNGNWKLG